jgi:hypothetical protein
VARQRSLEMERSFKLKDPTDFVKSVAELCVGLGAVVHVAGAPARVRLTELEQMAARLRYYDPSRRRDDRDELRSWTELKNKDHRSPE